MPEIPGDPSGFGRGRVYQEVFDISQITFRRNRVQVAGNDMTYQVNAMVSTETDRSVTVSGTGETVVDLQLDEAVGDARVQAQTAPFPWRCGILASALPFAGENFPRTVRFRPIAAARRRSCSR